MAAAPKRTQKHYAEAYGMSLSTVKRWWKDARVPWDQPDFMGELIGIKDPTKWERCLAAYDARTAGDEVTPAPTDQTPSPNTPLPVLGLDLPGGFGVGRGVARELERIEMACESAARLWQKHEAAGEDKEAAAACNRWMDLTTALRQMAKDTPKVLRDSGDSIPKSAAMGLVVRAAGDFAAALQGVAGRLGDLYGSWADVHEFMAAVEDEHLQALEYIRNLSFDDLEPTL